MYATDKQLRYCAYLASQLELRDEWDLIAAAAGCSRSKAQRKADMGTISSAIDWAKERLARRERRQGLPDGSVDAQSVLCGGRWIKLKPETLAFYSEHAARLDIARLAARHLELRSAGAETPFTSAVREQLAELG